MPHMVTVDGSLLPTSTDDLTPEWFSKALGSSITTVEIEPLDEGIGFLARTVRARLTEADGTHFELVVKFAAEGPARSIASSMGLYECEVRFYGELAAQTGIAVPRCLRADIDSDSGLFVLVISDLAPARGGDQLIGATDDEIAAAVSTAARLHATWWENRTLTTLGWLPSQAQMVSNTLEKAGDLYPAFAEAWSAELSDEELALGEKVTTHLQPLVDAIDHAPYTLVHGDYRLDNLFFAADGRVAVIDWQMSFRGHSGAFDLALLIASSLTSDDRRRLMKPLLQLYLDELNGNGVTGFSHGDLRRALAVAAGQLITRCPVAHQIPSANERAATMRARLIRGYWDIAEHVELDALL